jgi:hypothetical protein
MVLPPTYVEVRVATLSQDANRIRRISVPAEHPIGCVAVVQRQVRAARLSGVRPAECSDPHVRQVDFQAMSGVAGRRSRDHEPRDHEPRDGQAALRGTRSFLVAVVVTAVTAGGLAVAAVTGASQATANASTAVVAAGAGVGGAGVERPNKISANTDATPYTAPTAEVTPARNPPVMAVGSDGRSVRELQVRLGELGLFDAEVTGYYGVVTKGAVAAYQESRGEEANGSLYQDTWDALRAATSTPTTDQMYPPPPNVTPPAVQPGELDPRCMTGQVMCVDKTERVLRWVVDGRVLLQMDARFGSKALPTDEGVFHVFWKDRDHVSGVYESDMPFSMFFSGGQAVHYSQDFADVGYNGASHGCVNIRDYDHLEWLYDQVNVGDKVVVYWS